MVWPAQSPDLNRHRTSSGLPQRRLAEYEHHPKGMEELWRRIEEEWEQDTQLSMSGIDEKAC